MSLAAAPAPGNKRQVRVTRSPIGGIPYGHKYGSTCRATMIHDDVANCTARVDRSKAIHTAGMCETVNFERRGGDQEASELQKGDGKHESEKNRRPLLHACGRCLANPVSSCQTPHHAVSPSTFTSSPARTRFLYVRAPRLGMQNLTARGEPGAEGEAERVLLLLPQRHSGARRPQGRGLIAARRHAQLDQQRCVPEILKSASEEEPHRTLQLQQGQSGFKTVENRNRIGASMFCHCKLLVIFHQGREDETSGPEEKTAAVSLPLLVRGVAAETCRDSSSMGLNRSELPVERSRKDRPIRRDARSLTTAAATTSRPDEAGTRRPRRRRRRAPPFVACCAISSSSSSAWTCSARR